MDQFLGVWRKVPGLDPMLAQLDHLNVLHTRYDIVVMRGQAARLPRTRGRRRGG